MSEPRWTATVLGPGGVGLLIGAVLGHAGHPVRFLATSATAAELNSRGVRVSSLQYGDFAMPASAGASTSGRFDVCFVTVKAPDLAAALDRIRADDLGDGLIVSLLNGVEHMELLRHHFPPAQVVAGTIRVETARSAPGCVEHITPFMRIEVASGTAAPGRVAELAIQLGLAGLDTTVRPDEKAMLWEKLTYLAPLALMTTHVQASIGVVREEHRDQLCGVVAETAAVASAEGVVTEATTVLDLLDKSPAGMRSSMLRDAQANRPTELEAIGGAVLRAGRRHGMHLPVTERLVNGLRRRAVVEPRVGS